MIIEQLFVKFESHLNLMLKQKVDSFFDLQADMSSSLG